MSNIKLTKNEKKKISFVDHIIENEHEEKDFGSWKIGLDYLKQKEVHNLVLTNDGNIMSVEYRKTRSLEQMDIKCHCNLIVA